MSLSSLNKYIRKEKLGEGTYGVVYLCHTTNGRVVAMKKIKIDPHEEGIPATTLREVSLLNELKHPCIVRLLESVYENRDLYLIFEYMDNDLKQYLDHSASNPSLSLLKSFSYLLIEGVRFCHSRRVLHRDLKPQNILISRSGQLKIADLGLGREHTLPIAKLTHEVVTLWYRPPEILLGQETYSGAADVWGIGCIVAEIATRRPLLPGDSEFDQICKIFQLLGTPNEEVWPGVEKLPDFKPHFPKWSAKDLAEVLRHSELDRMGLDLIQRMLVYAPHQRVTAKAALRHPWFDDIRDSMEARLRREHEAMVRQLQNEMDVDQNQENRPRN